MSDRGGKAKRIPVFHQCPGCGYDVITGEGVRGCSWYECPYLPEDFKVHCPVCDFNFATGEGQPHCENTDACEWASEGKRHAEIVRQSLGRD
ncbi:MAG: hypothetical protein WDA27_14040 [Actinomycetota bacterium]